MRNQTSSWAERSINEHSVEETPISRSEQSGQLRHMISEFVEQSDGELYTGDLLEGVKEKMGVAALGAALLELFRMSGEGEVMMVEDTDSMRIKVIKNKGAELS